MANSFIRESGRQGMQAAQFIHGNRLELLADRLIDDLAALAAQKGTTLVVVSHDPAMYARMDRVVGIVDGRLVE